MDKDKIILSKTKINDGMKVPEGYFDNFATQMFSELPEHKEFVPEEVPQTFWQRVRPYVYMAAMFLGIWCMLKMFTLITTTTPQTIESNPIMAEALNNESFVNEYVIGELSQWDIYDEMMEDSITPDMLCDTLIFN